MSYEITIITIFAIQMIVNFVLYRHSVIKRRETEPGLWGLVVMINLCCLGLIFYVLVLHHSQRGAV